MSNATVNGRPALDSVPVFLNLKLNSDVYIPPRLRYSQIVAAFKGSVHCGVISFRRGIVLKKRRCHCLYFIIYV